MRTCKKCGSGKPLEEFTPATGCLGGRSRTCIVCTKRIAKEYRKNNKAALNEKNKQWRKANPDTPRRLAKEWREANPERYRRSQRNSTLKREYGITLERYEEMRVQQGCSCLICSEPFDGKSPCVDHCHDTGAVRGLLCASCNFALGLLKDRPELMRRAADYVEKSRGQEAS